MGQDLHVSHFLEAEVHAHRGKWFFRHVISTFVCTDLVPSKEMLEQWKHNRLLGKYPYLGLSDVQCLQALELLNLLGEFNNISIPEAEILEQQYLADTLQMMLLQTFAAFQVQHGQQRPLGRCRQRWKKIYDVVVVGCLQPCCVLEGQVTWLASRRGGRGA